MRIEILFFAQLKEALGRDDETLDVDDTSTVADVVSVLAERPEWGPVQALPLSYAVNEEHVDGSHTLGEGDRLALLPPVSGG